MAKLTIGLIALLLAAFAPLSFVFAVVAFWAADCQEGVDWPCDPVGYTAIGFLGLVAAVTSGAGAFVAWRELIGQMQRARKP